MDPVIAKHRFAYGAAPASVRDGRAWLLDQLAAPAPGPEVPFGPAVRMFWDDIRERQMPERDMMMEPLAPALQALVDELPPLPHPSWEQTTLDAYERTVHAVESPTPFVERLVRFWSNHFTVEWGKSRMQAALMERDAIRPHVTGRFAEMLRAVTTHPAMLLYLDNTRNFGPDSFHGGDINENLARELMELHSLGVDGGYTQADVEALSLLLTGWTVVEGYIAAYFPEDLAQTRFIEAMAQPGPKTIMGRTYGGGRPSPGDLDALIEDLAASPATADHLARKLLTHFVSDAPAGKDVRALAQAYLDSGGDLPTVYTAMLDLPAAQADFPGKYKTPDDFVTSTLAALGLDRATLDRLDAEHQARDGVDYSLKPALTQWTLSGAGQPVWQAPDPKGWSDLEVDWLTGTAVNQRAGYAIWTADLARPEDTLALAESLYGDRLSPATREVIANARDPYVGAVALLLSPEFQRR